MISYRKFVGWVEPIISSYLEPFVLMTVRGYNRSVTQEGGRLWPRRSQRDVRGAVVVDRRGERQISAHLRADAMVVGVAAPARVVPALDRDPAEVLPAVQHGRGDAQREQDRSEPQSEGLPYDVAWAVHRG